MAQKWGSILFLISFVSTLLQTSFKSLRGGTSNDFDIFLSSAQLLLKGENPYGINYPGGQYLYSPSAGLFYYGPLAQLSYASALIFNSIILFSVFLFSIFWLSKQDTKISEYHKNIFFLLLTFEALGSLLNGKFELLTAGVFFLVYASFLSNRSKKTSMASLAIVSNFKLQALAASGLLLPTLKWGRGTLKILLSYILGILCAFSLPIFFLGFHKNIELLFSWKKESALFIQSTFEERSHLWSFIKSCLGVSFDASTISLLSAAVALSFFLYCLALKDKKNHFPQSHTLRALALGGAFSVVFSPAAQSSAYILLAPLYWALCKLGSCLIEKKQKIIWHLGTLSGLFFVSLCYSDLVGKSFRAFARTHSLKALGGLIFLLTFIYFDTHTKTADKGNNLA